MRILLDEHFSPEIARQLRARGYDCAAVAERSDLLGAADGHHLVAMIQEGRAIVTEDVADYRALAATMMAEGHLHAGLIFTTPRRFPRRKEAVGLLVRALETLLSTQPGVEALQGREHWLEVPTD